MQSSLPRSGQSKLSVQTFKNIHYMDSSPLALILFFILYIQMPSGSELSCRCNGGSSVCTAMDNLWEPQIGNLTTLKVSVDLLHS